MTPDALPHNVHPQAVRWWAFAPLRNPLLAAVLALAAWMAGGWLGLPPRLEILAFATSIVLGGWFWARESLEALWSEGAIDIGFLMIAATIGSALLGLWDEAAALVVLFGVAEGVEEYTQATTRNAVRALMNLVPQSAAVIEQGVERTVPASSLRPGMQFRVRPGERFPTDGRITDGATSVNQAPVTGESLPVPRGPGEDVFAGSINGDGAVTVQATHAFADNSIARIIHLVEQAQEQKGRAQQWIDRFGRRYTPMVLAVAVGMCIVAWLVDASMSFWVQKAIVLLVAAAPCALVISTPISMAAGIRSASRYGILIKGGVHLEHLAGIRGVAFDKTGTLTMGAPRVVAFEAFDGAEDTALAIAASLEGESRHPLALAVVEAAARRGIRPFPVTDFTAMNGSGISGRIDGMRWNVASAGWFAERSELPSAVSIAVARERNAGRTVSLLGSDSGVQALIAMADAPRAEAREAVEQLRHLNLRLVMLSGDNTVTAMAMAKSLGIDDARGDLKPEDKVRAIEGLQVESGPMLMVGDGVNDAPALAAATCSIAMGTAGSDAAIEAADVALLSEDLRRVALAIRISRHAMQVSRQNIVLSIAVLVVMIPSALVGWIGITTAVIVHEAAELLAVLNGLRAGQLRGEATIDPAEARP